MPVALPSEFERGFRAILGRLPGEREQVAFSKYLDLLLKWGSVHRLVGSNDPQWVVEHLFLDSLLFLKLVPTDANVILDLGSGAGLPGVPIAITRPESRVSLLESRQRRASFLRTVVRELELTGTTVLAARAEDLAGERAESFDAVVVRCAGRLAEILPAATALARPGGVVVAAGPPKPSPLVMGEWRVVPGVRRGSTRRFAVVEKAGR